MARRVGVDGYERLPKWQRRALIADAKRDMLDALDAG
jgi:hypothetical protein